MLKRLLNASIKGCTSLWYLSSNLSSWNRIVSVFKYSNIVLFKCSAKCPSISASTAVLLIDSIGISIVFRSLPCLLNSFETIKARALEGTARVFLYGVFILFPSSWIKYLIFVDGILVQRMRRLLVYFESRLLIKSLHVISRMTRRIADISDQILCQKVHDRLFKNV